MNAVMRFQVEISMGLDAFIPVWDALRCHFSQPWGFSCNDPQDQLRCQTSLRRPHRIYHPAAHKFDFQLQQRAIKLCAGWLLNVLNGNCSLTWYRIITCVTFVLRSRFSCFSSLVRTERTKSPGLLWLSRTRKLPALPLSVSSFSASRPDRCPWYHLGKRPF